MATKVTLDGYAESNISSYLAMSSAYDKKSAQSFTCSETIKLDSCKFKLYRYGSLTGNVTAELYAHTGTYGSTGLPTGSPLAVSDAKSSSTISKFPTSYTFTFSGENSILLTPNYYCIAVCYSGGDTSNVLYRGVDYSSPTHSGNGSSYRTSWDLDSYDMPFYVYGTTVDYNSPVSIGTIELIGINTTLKSSRNTTTTKVEFTLTGINNSFGTGKGIQAGTGGFDLTGVANSYCIAITYPVLVNTYAFTGNSVNLKRAYTISATKQTYSLTLKDNNFDTGIGMVTSVGTLTLTGKNITLTVGSLWTKQAKNTDTWTNETENTASWTNETESPATWSNNQGYLLMEDGDYLLQENGDKIVIAKFYTEDDTWTNETENTSTWTKI